MLGVLGSQNFQVAKSVEGGTGAKEMFPGPQEPAPEVPGTGNHVGKVFHGGV